MQNFFGGAIIYLTGLRPIVLLTALFFTQILLKFDLFLMFPVPPRKLPGRLHKRD